MKYIFTLLPLLACVACMKTDPCGESSQQPIFTNEYNGKAYIQTESYAYKDSVLTAATFISNKGDRYVYPKAAWTHSMNMVNAQYRFDHQDPCGSSYYIIPQYESEKWELKMLNSSNVYCTFNIVIDKNENYFKTMSVDTHTVKNIPDRLRLITDYTFSIIPPPDSTDKNFKQVIYDTLTLGKYVWKNLRYTYLDSSNAMKLKNNVPIGFYYDLKRGVVGFNWNNGTRWYLE